jgi:hypothetical protein
MTVVDLYLSPRPGGIAQLVLDGLLLVPSHSYGLRVTEAADLASATADGAGGGRGAIVVHRADAGPGPAGAVVVFDRLPEQLDARTEALARRLSGAAVTCADDVDRLTPLVDGPVAYVGTPTPGALPAAEPSSDALTVLLGDGAACPGCRWSQRFGPLPEQVRLLRDASVATPDPADALCPACRAFQEAAPLPVRDAWALPGLLRGRLALAGDPADAYYDVACRIAEVTGRPVVDLSGTPVPRWGDDPTDRELLTVTQRMEGLLLEVMHRRPVRVTAEKLGAHFAARPGATAVAELVGTAFGELFGRALEPTPHPARADASGVPHPRTHP